MQPSSYRPYAMVRYFHEKFTPNQKYDAMEMKLERRMQLISEEYKEVIEALEHWNSTLYGETSSTEEECKIELAKELADLLYMIYGTADELDIPIKAVFKAVHRSNMEKIWDDGEVHYNEYGKVLKPPGHQPPNIKAIINATPGSY